MGVSGFTRTQELSIPINVNLESHWICIPWIVGSVTDLSNHLKGVSSVHFWNDFTANKAVGICWVNCTTWWQIAVTTVHQIDEPVRRVRADEVAQVCCFTNQCFRRTIPVGWVWFRLGDLAEHKACAIERLLVVQGRPVPEATITVVDGGIEVVHWVDTGEDHLSLDVHAVHHSD